MFEAGKLPVSVDTSTVLFESQHVAITIRQLALDDELTGGNKWFKLKYNFLKARSLGINKIITFGGAFSNHIAATARAGKLNGFETIGIIRGEESSKENKTLSRASEDGMQLIFVSRENYRKKNESEFLSSIIDNLNNYFIIPEGGANAEGVQGCMEILSEADAKYDHVVVCCGTGTTAAGLILKMKPHQKLTGISVLRDGGSIETEINKWLSQFKTNSRLPTWEINHDFHFGGYAKTTPELISYCQTFKTKTGIAIEPVYTGKLFFALEQLIASNYFEKDANILAIYTGGLQYVKE